MDEIFQGQALERGLLFYMSNPTQKVIVYVDGYNFYYGLKEVKWKKYYWLDLVSFFESFMQNGQELVGVKYFSAPTNNQEKRKRQSDFFSANKLNDRFELILGNYLNKNVYCRNCHTDFEVPEEKKTDVNIATQMIADCIYHDCDISIIVSGDSDLTPPIHFIKQHNPDHKVFVYFPPRRQGLHLKNICDSSLYLEHWKKRFRENLLPETITTKSGYQLKKPSEWS